MKSIRSIANGQLYITVSSLHINEDEISLRFQLEAKESSSEFSSLSNDQQTTRSVILWNKPEIQDFIRRLGFVNFDSANTDMNIFVELNEVSLLFDSLFDNLYVGFSQNSKVNAITV